MKNFFSENRCRKVRVWVIAAGVLLLLVYWTCEALAAGSGQMQNLRTVFAESQNSGESAEAKTASGDPVLDLHAGGAVLMDGYTGRVLYEKNGSQVLPMASTTKIMTCILALEYGDLQEAVEVSAYAASMPDVQLGIIKGEQYRLGDLLFSLMLESHNDSAVAIAEHIAAGQAEEKERIPAASERSVEESKKLVSDFADLMNRKAAEIGCTHTYFITPNGLDASVAAEGEDGKPVERVHSTTAAELALIMRYCLVQSEKSDSFLELTQTREASFSDEAGRRSFSCMNHNRYLDMKEGAVSGKTGYTGKAGYCYVGAVNQDGVFLIVSLLACGWPPSKNLKWQDMNTLVNYGMENYSCVQVSELQNKDNSGSYLIDQVPGKAVELVQIRTQVLFEPFFLLLKEGEKLSGSWYLEPKSVKMGETVGEYRVVVDGTICRSFPLTAWQAQIWNK